MNELAADARVCPYRAGLLSLPSPMSVGVVGVAGPEPTRYRDEQWTWGGPSGEVAAKYGG